MFQEDLTLFLSPSEFSVPAQATTRFGEVVQFQVIFDNGYQSALGGLVESTGPSALVQTIYTADLAHGSTLQIACQTWQVVEVQPDGTGMTLLRLREAV
jgi:hypothetical protein